MITFLLLLYFDVRLQQRPLLQEYDLLFIIYITVLHGVLEKKLRAHSSVQPHVTEWKQRVC